MSVCLSGIRFVEIHWGVEATVPDSGIDGLNNHQLSTPYIWTVDNVGNMEFCPIQNMNPLQRLCQAFCTLLTIDVHHSFALSKWTETRCLASRDWFPPRVPGTVLTKLSSTPKPTALTEAKGTKATRTETHAFDKPTWPESLAVRFWHAVYKQLLWPRIHMQKRKKQYDRSLRKLMCKSSFSFSGTVNILEYNLINVSDGNCTITP